MANIAEKHLAYLITTEMKRIYEQNNAIHRNTGFDILRCFAIFSVIAGHFFSLHTNFKNEIFAGTSMFLQASIAPVFYACGVPLFLLLTGYLNCYRKIEKTYFHKIWKVLFAYLLFSIISIIFRNSFLNEQLDIKQSIDMILRFNAIPYAWYIELWIGLFLLTPFLNIMYHGIQNKTHKQILIAILLFLTALPALLNRYGLHLIPSYWQTCYPLALYFIGVYICEYKPIIHAIYGILIIIVICLINPIFNLLFIHNHPLIQISGDSSGLFGFAIAIAMFLLLYQVEISSALSKKILIKTANLSLDMYLCCWIFDTIFYTYFKSSYFVDQGQFGKYFFIIVPLVFISSFAVAWLKDVITKKTL
jgi:surface polysaccharide O-acyltransferase-like enzyme